MDLNYSRGAGVRQAATDFRLARANTITDWSYQQRKEVRLQIDEAYRPFPQNKLSELYYVNKMIETEKTAALKCFFWGTCPKGGLKKNPAILLSSTRWGNWNEFPTKGAALVMPFPCVCKLDLVRPEKWSQF